MEKKFLLYVLYTAFIDLRARAYENNDTYTFGLCDLLHNLPLQMISDQGEKSAYQHLSDKVKGLDMEKWMENRKEEFYQRFPEYINLNEDSTE